MLKIVRNFILTGLFAWYALIYLIMTFTSPFDGKSIYLTVLDVLLLLLNIFFFVYFLYLFTISVYSKLKQFFNKDSQHNSNDYRKESKKVDGEDNSRETSTDTYLNELNK